MQIFNTSNGAKRRSMPLPKRIISTLFLGGLLLSGMEANAQGASPRAKFDSND